MAVLSIDLVISSERSVGVTDLRNHHAAAMRYFCDPFSHLIFDFESAVMDAEDGKDWDNVDGYMREDLKYCEYKGVLVRSMIFQDQKDRNKNVNNESHQINQKLHFYAPILL